MNRLHAAAWLILLFMTPVFATEIVSLSSSFQTLDETNTFGTSFNVHRNIEKTPGLLTPSDAGDLNVNYLIEGTASNGVDYKLLSGTVTIGSGFSSATVSIIPINDSLPEGFETIVITLTPGNYTIDTSTANRTRTFKLYDDEIPHISIQKPLAAPRERGSVPSAFKIIRASANRSTVVKFTVAGSATPDVDYTALPSEATIAKDQTSVALNIPPLDDALRENDESIVVTLLPDPAYEIDSDVGSASTYIEDDESQEAYVVSNVAGLGPTSFSGDGKLALESTLAFPYGLALDSAGNLYIAEAGTSRVRVIDVATGLLNTVAGSGVRGFSGDGASATAAQLKSPNDVAFDASGVLYISDTGNHRIRRVDLSTQTITTVAGNGLVDASGVGLFGGDGGPAIEASLSSPGGISFDRNGNLLIADSGNHRVRRVDAATGIITTVAGTGTPAQVLPTLVGSTPASITGENGPATAADLNTPLDAVADASGNLYIADSRTSRLCKVDPAGTLTTVASVTSPRALAFDRSGNLLIVSNSRIMKFNLSDPVLSVFAGGGVALGEGAPAVSTLFPQPISLAVSANGDVYVSEQRPFDRIRKVASGTIIQADSDLDGFPDAFESAAGTDPNSSLSSSTNGQAISQFRSLRTDPLSTSSLTVNGIKIFLALGIDLNFAKPGTDKVTLKGAFSVGGSGLKEGDVTVINIGGMIKTFTLRDGYIEMGDPADKVTITTSSSAVKINAAYKGNYAAAFSDERLLDETVKKERRIVPIVIVSKTRVYSGVFGNGYYYTATSGRSGKLKSSKSGGRNVGSSSVLEPLTKIADLD
ncbi:MAG TPA: Calx-beta domain-containing protein [Planctomycetota bacterium]|nr:Calx-beta domain-containing protein [Planctomycetota bacterium]